MNKATSPPVSHRVGITLTPEECRRLREAAARAFIPASTFARQAVMAALRDGTRSTEAA